MLSKHRALMFDYDKFDNELTEILNKKEKNECGNSALLTECQQLVDKVNFIKNRTEVYAYIIYVCFVCLN